MTLEELVQHFGSQAAIARALEVTPQVVSEWKRRNRVSLAGQLKAEIVTRGAMRADIKAPGIESVPTSSLLSTESQ